MRADDDLARRAAAGDVGAFNELFAKHYSTSLRTIAYVLDHDRDATEDAAQEAWLNVYCKLSQFDGRSSFRTWLYRIATNEAYDQLRKKRSSKAGLFDSLEVLDPLGEHMASPQPRPDELGGGLEIAANIRGTYDRLRAWQKKSLANAHLYEFSVELEVALTGLSDGTIKSRRSRAREYFCERALRAPAVRTLSPLLAEDPGMHASGMDQARVAQALFDIAVVHGCFEDYLSSSLTLRQE